MQIKDPVIKRFIARVKNPAVIAFLFMIFILFIIGIVIEFIRPEATMETLTRMC